MEIACLNLMILSVSLSNGFWYFSVLEDNQWEEYMLGNLSDYYLLFYLRRHILLLASSLAYNIYMCRRENLQLKSVSTLLPFTSLLPSHGAFFLCCFLCSLFNWFLASFSALLCFTLSLSISYLIHSLTNLWQKQWQWHDLGLSVLHCLDK